MKAIALLLLAGLPILFTQACSDDTGEEPDDDAGASSSSSGSSGASSSSSGGSSSGSSSGGSSSGGSSSGGKPDDCEDLDFTGGVPLRSQTQNQFDTAFSTALLRTVPTVFVNNGDATLPDRLDIFLHGRVGVGTLQLDPDPNKLFVRSKGDEGDNYMPNCEACAQLRLDISANDAGVSSYAKTFAAVGGSVEVQTAVTPHQTQGVVHGLEFREMQLDPATRYWTRKQGGQCYWAAEVPFDTRRENGCKPFAADDTCGQGKFCMPVNSIGTDGECTATGDLELGDDCTRNADQSWDSECGPGLRCFKDSSEPDEASATCRQICDELAATNACPAGTTCGGGYNMCMDNAALADSGLDPVAIGEVCTQKTGDGSQWANYCGGTGKKRGICIDTDGMAGPLPPKCEALFASVTEKPAGRSASYIGYKGGLDQSTLWSVALPFVP